MKSFMKKVDLFCYRHPKFGVPKLMLYIVIANVAVWLFSAMDTTGMLLNYLSFSAPLVLRGQIWRIFTFVFVPQASGLALLLFLYFYYFIGSTLEREWGAGRFTIYYLFGMTLTVVYGFIAYFIGGSTAPVSAEFINLSMFFAFATLFPDMQVLLFFIIPIKVKWLAIVDALYFAYAIFAHLGMGYGMLAFLPLVAVANYFLFCGGELLSEVLPQQRHARKNTVDFKREVNRMKYEQKTKDYTRKCAVCGRTDTEYPELEFRYCSRCAGYHCFCEDHINNHIHFSE